MFDLDKLKTYKEGNRLEVKRALGRNGQGELPRSVWETVSAFANTTGGVIVLGVTEDKDDGSFIVHGIPKADKVLDDFWNAALSEDKLSARFMKDADASVETVDGKDVVVIRVPWVDRHIRPVFIDNSIFGGTFRRTHTGDHQCKREEVLSMLRDSDTSSQDSKVIERARMEDLDYGTVGRYRNVFRAEHGGSEWNSYDDEAFLRALGAAGTGEDGQTHPTGAGLLMFGKDRWITDEFPHYFLDYRQEAEAIERWADRFTSQPGDWSGNVYDFYFRVYNKLKAALKVPFALDSDMRRIDDTPAHKALREAIANCLTNANYYERRGIVCVWGDDAITIENPGDFRLPIEEARKPGASDPRNETMLKIFSFVNIGERAGSGMGTIENGWTAGGYPAPTYEVVYGPDRTKLTLPLVTIGESTSEMQAKTSESAESSNETTESARKVREKCAKSARKCAGQLSSSEIAVAELIEAESIATTTRIVEVTGLSRRGVQKIVGSLIEQGVVLRVGSGRNTRYKIAED